jgi:CHAT domain-containing protein/Tfp pilus assembly protein PilF
MTVKEAYSMLFSFRLSLCLLALNLSPVDAALGQSQSPSSALSIRYSARGKTIAFGLSALDLLQVDSRAQGSASEQLEEAALRVVIEKYFSAYGKKDLAGVVALWSEKAPDLATYKQGLQRQFTNEEIRFGSLAISRVKVEGEKANLRVTIALTSTNMKSRRKSEQLLANNLELIKEGMEWKLWRYVSAAEELAAALVKADTEAEREALLANEKELAPIELGRALLEQGRRLISQGSYKRAIDSNKLALDIAVQAGDKGVAADALRGIGNVHYRLDAYTEALEQYRKSLRISEEIGDKNGIARSLNNIGNVDDSKGDYTEALEQYHKSLRISEEIGDKDGIARSLNNSGNIHYRLGAYTEALEQYHKSLRISEEIGDKNGIARSLNNIGNVNDSKGDHTEALEQYHKSLRIREIIGDKNGIARLLTNIGNVHVSQGAYTEALEQYHKSLRISEEIGDRSGIAATLANVGIVHSLQDNYAQALEHYQKSMKIQEEIGDKADIANTLNNIGVVHKSQGAYTEALEQYQKSLRIKEEIGDKAGIATSLNNIGGVHHGQGDYIEALEKYHKSLRIREEIGDKPGIAASLINISEAHLSQGNYTQALQFAGRAADLAAQIGSRRAFWEARANAGKAFFALKQIDQARQSFDQAIATIESLRADVAGGEQERQRSFESKISPYHAMVELLIAQNDPHQALSYAERARARVLLDVLSSGRLNVTKTMTAAEIDQERELKGRLVSLNTGINLELQRQQPDQDRLNNLEAQLRRARLDLEAFQTNLYVAHPELRPQRGEAPIINAQEIAALLPDARSALLEYVVTDDRTYLFAITRAESKPEAEVRVYTLPIKRADLAKQIESFRRQLAGRDFGFRGPAQQLYRLLLRPAYAQIQGKSNLIIAPDDKLWELPFQALINEGGRYVVETGAVSYAPSLTVLREMRVQRNKRRDDVASLDLLALGNPAIGEETIGRAIGALRNGHLGPLPVAEQEVKALEHLYGAARSKIYVGPGAQEGRVKTEGRQARVLHFATHGILNDSSPMYSHLVLARGDKNEDGLLEAWELMQMDLHADLAVLSACETARGRFSAGEGVIGLSWAMFVAGVPATLVSQWKVVSAGTRDLMLNFHRQLKELKASSTAARATAMRSEALRQAARKMMKNPRTRHPFYWAGFVLVGDSR